MAARIKETVSRKFRATWPDFAALAKLHGIDVWYSGRAFWAEGDYQLTGFSSIIVEGVPRAYTLADAEKRISGIIDSIIAGRALNATMTPRARFARAVEGLGTMTPRANMISSWRDPGGDSSAACGWRGMPTDFRVNLRGIGEVAKVDAPSILHAIPLLWDSFERWEAKK